MIEQAIYFALGCCATALLALLFMPVLWNRALRLSRKRLQLQVPLSMQEILAERDHLRAAQAVERLRLEQEMTRVRAGKDADMIAIGRGTVEASRLAEEVGALRKLNEAQSLEIALLATAVSEHKVESSALRNDLAAAHTNVEALRGDAEAANAERARLAEEGEGHRSSAAALVARLSEHEGAQATITRLENELVIVHGELDAERDRQKGFHLSNSLKVEKDRAADRAAAERLDRLEADNLTLKQRLTAQGQRLDDDAYAGDASLRESIHALGLAVADLRQKKNENLELPPQ